MMSQYDPETLNIFTRIDELLMGVNPEIYRLSRLFGVQEEIRTAVIDLGASALGETAVIRDVRRSRNRLFRSGNTELDRRVSVRLEYPTSLLEQRGTDEYVFRYPFNAVWLSVDKPDIGLKIALPKNPGMLEETLVRISEASKIQTEPNFT